MSQRGDSKDSDALSERFDPSGRLARAAATFACFAPTFAVVALLATSYLGERARLSDETPPETWATSADASQRMTVAGHAIQYWGKPGARYSNYASRGAKPPRGIVVHFTRAAPVLAMVKYGHARDFSRGGASFGYHFYIGRDGQIVQGAPLNKRTNHIKSTKRRERTRIARHLWSGNAIGISLVGACDTLLRPNRIWRPTNCSGEFVTAAQLGAGLALIKALQARYRLPCHAVFGHGDLQTDRATFEGATLRDRVRAGCSVPAPSRRRMVGTETAQKDS